jgi:hypothetical protein
MLGYRNANNITNVQLQLINELIINKVGQTFYEITTQQPYKFAKNNISVTSSSIILRWNYDSIIPKHDSINVAKLANIFDYTQYLPFIKNIFVDISGFVDLCNNDNTNYNIYNNTWINLRTITISGDYNVNNYKNYVFERSDYINLTDVSSILIKNIINNAMPFSMRVYGANYSNNYPTIESRSLIFKNLIFLNGYTPSMLDLNALHVYEISNIELMGSNLNNIVLKHYNSHSNIILPCTLLYINSCFNNVFGIYPNSAYGNISFDLSGIIVNNNQGYKWIVFKIFKNNDVSNSYLFNAISYNIITTSDGNNIKYLPLKIMLKNNNLFLDSIVDKIFNITDNSALMFGHATTISNNKRYFNIKQNFNGLGGIWTENSNSNNISYNSTANSKIFGSNVNNDGIYCPINNLNDDLTIYIGLKELVV